MCHLTKTTNLYKLSKESYNKPLTEIISNNYKKSNIKLMNEIDCKAKQIETKLNIADRVESYARRDTFITHKDHKENFENNPK